MDNIINLIAEKLQKNESGKINITVQGMNYELHFIAPVSKEGINIPSLVLVPLTENMNNQIMLESNNMETSDLRQLVAEALNTGDGLLHFTSENPCPIVVPLLPSEKDGPYYQQLSKQSIMLPSSHKYYGLDEQVLKIVDKVSNYIEKEKHIEMKEKLFLNGYSSSGCFAERFAFIHPERIDVACIGGAIGDIPILDDRLGYPLGTADYYELFGKFFDKSNYLKIKFRTYVGEKEDVEKSNTRVDKFGNPAPMHDMTYMERSVPKEVGQKARELFGIDMFERSNRIMDELISEGLDIKHTVFEGRTHNDRSGHGVNELRHEFIKDTYNESLDNGFRAKINNNVMIREKK